MTVLNLYRVIDADTPITVCFEDYVAKQDNIFFSGYAYDLPDEYNHKIIKRVEPSTRVRITDEFEGSSYYETGLYIAVE